MGLDATRFSTGARFYCCGPLYLVHGSSHSDSSTITRGIFDTGAALYRDTRTRERCYRDWNSGRCPTPQIPLLSVDSPSMARVVSLCRPCYGQSAERGIRSFVARGRTRGNTMNLTRWTLNHFVKDRFAKPDMRLRISNLSRQAVAMTQQKNLRTIAEFLVVGICIVAFALTTVGICAVVSGSDAAGTRDFAEYWASGHQLAHHSNPYDGDAILG